MKGRWNFALVACSFLSMPLLAQLQDTGKVHQLKAFQLTADRPNNEVEKAPEFEGTSIYSGKKNSRIHVATLDADLSVNNPRQLFAKVPGISIWENDGSGIQTSIASRGLNPNRSWEFNVRQNGSDIAAEVFGYPESYYTPPTEAVQTIEVVRGAAALQYGPQFGGLLNYILKKGDPTKPIVVESKQTTGAYGLFNSYTAIGGTKKRFSYYAFFHHRNANGWRQNSRYHINTGYLSVSYALTKKVNIDLSMTRMDYLSQQAGGLTDEQFASNPQASTRARNWLAAPWNVYSLKVAYKINDKSNVSLNVFATDAQRNSVGFLKSISVADTINALTNAYNTRQIDRDIYLNTGAELRFLQQYTLRKIAGVLAIGARYYKGDTRRFQLGVGTTGSNYDLTHAQFINGRAWERELSFNSINSSLYIENIFKVGKRLSITPGARLESLTSSKEGYVASLDNKAIDLTSIQRNFLLMGIGAEYALTSSSNFYGNISESYRPVTFSELTPTANNDSIDVALKDASGYSIDLGYRGKWKSILQVDIGVFYLNYSNRLGTVLVNERNLRTNIGESLSKGLESFIEIQPTRFFKQTTKWGDVKLFVSYAHVDARYTKWDNPALLTDPKKSIKDKRVEYAPSSTFRGGITYLKGPFSISYQWNSVSGVFTDAANTLQANSTATIGFISGYRVMDCSLSYSFNSNYSLKAGINNIADETYATRRANGYPGPGLLPGNGRTYFVGLNLKL
jgi:Fe(3+) dicitrate transport protein